MARTATFEIELTPSAAELDGAVARGCRGRFAPAQLGTMHAGSQQLHHAVVPGSGDGELAGITGALRLPIEQDGTHRYALDYEL